MILKARCMYFVLGLLLLPWLTAMAQTPADRTITMRIVVSEEVSATPDWEQTVRDAVSDVSTIYEKNFQIRWEILDIVHAEWAASPNLEHELENLSRNSLLGEADVLIEIYSLKCRTQKQRFKQGWARPFGFQAIVMTGCKQKGGLPLEQILSHELAHLFGAFHVAEDVPSVMGGGRADQFDSHNRRIIELMRDFDFSQGVAGLSTEKQRAWSAIYAEVNHADESNILALAIRNNGQQLALLGKNDEAIVQFREAIKIDDTIASAHQVLGIILARQQNFEAAMVEFQKAVHLDPTNALIHINIATALSNQKQWDEAAGEYLLAIKLDPDNAVAHQELGELELNRGALDKAIAHSREAIRIDPQHAKAYADLGTALSMQGKLEEGVVELREAIRLDPEQGVAHGNLGFNLSQQGRWAEAISAYHEALRINPNDARNRINLENALRQQ